MFIKNFKKGKLHLGYIKKDFYIIKIFESLVSFLTKLNNEKKVSCCIYKTEVDFLKNQKTYFYNYFEIIKKLIVCLK